MVSNEPSGIVSGVEFKEIYTEDICLITAEDHPWSDLQSVKLDQLSKEVFILPTENTHTYQTINNKLTEHGLSLRNLDTFLTLSNPEAIILSVQKGLGVGFSSRVIANELGKVACISLEGIQIKRQITISQDTNQPSSAARKAFWDFMISISDSIQI